MDTRSKLVQTEAKGEVVKLLFSDVDRCLLNMHYWSAGGTLQLNPRPDLLSQAVIDFASQVGVRAVGLCTHRHFKVLFQWMFTAEMYGNYVTHKQPDFQASCLLTHQVAANFSQAMGLPCLAVSTPDDVNPLMSPDSSGLCCGQAFEQLLKPYEMSLLEKNKQQFAEGAEYKTYVDVISEPTLLTLYAPSYASNSKNAQYIHIAELAAYCYPGARRILVYLPDDIEAICQNALHLPPEQLPANVTLVIIHHNDFANISMKVMGKVLGTGPKDDLSSFHSSTPRLYRQLQIQTGPLSLTQQTRALLGKVDDEALTPLAEEVSGSGNSRSALSGVCPLSAFSSSDEEYDLAQPRFVLDPGEENPAGEGQPAFPVSAPIAIPGRSNLVG